MEISHEVSTEDLFLNAAALFDLCFRLSVTWKQMEVGGQCYKNALTAVLTFTVRGRNTKRYNLSQQNSAYSLIFTLQMSINISQKNILRNFWDYFDEFRNYVLMPR